MLAFFVHFSYTVYTRKNETIKRNSYVLQKIDTFDVLEHWIKIYNNQAQIKSMNLSVFDIIGGKKSPQMN